MNGLKNTVNRMEFPFLIFVTRQDLTWQWFKILKIHRKISTLCLAEIDILLLINSQSNSNFIKKKKIKFVQTFIIWTCLIFCTFFLYKRHYEIMKKCWNLKPSGRPSFAEINKEIESLFRQSSGDLYYYDSSQK